MVHLIFAAARRHLSSFWADRPLRVKGLLVIAVPLTALVGVTASFYLLHHADQEADSWINQASQVGDVTQTCLTDLLEGEGALNEYVLTGRTERLARVNNAASAFYAKCDRLRLQDDPVMLRRLQHVRELFRQEMESWADLAPYARSGTRPAVSHAELYGRSQSAVAALLVELQAMNAAHESGLAMRLALISRLRMRQSAAITANALLGLGGGLLAILMFTAGVARGLRGLQQDTARLEQGLPVLPQAYGRDEIGSLKQSLETASANLRSSEEERDRFFTISVDMLCIMDLDGHFKRVNPAFTAILGHPEADLLAQGILGLVHAEDREAAARRIQEMSSGLPITYQESRFGCADGSYKWLAWSGAPFLAEGTAYAVLRNITGRKLDEQALRQSNARLFNALDSMTDGFFSVDRAWRLTFVNPEAERVWMRQKEDLLGRSLYDVFPEGVDGPFFRMYEQVMRTGKPDDLEDFYPYPPLNRWFEAHAYSTTDGLSVHFRDVTERHEAEEQILRALQEKEILLREVHHRVKNNLQVIYSMLRLQAGYVHDEGLLQVLRECRERVHAMALLHDQLHRAKDLSSIRLGEYIKSLAASLFCSYGVQSSKIGLRINLEDIAASIDTAIPCGLIVHELVSNSVRHAFPGSATGHVSLGLRARPGGDLELTIGDDGRGFSPSADPGHTPSLGLRLVSLLAAQLEAQVERTNQAGTHYRFVFRSLDQKESE